MSDSDRFGEDAMEKMVDWAAENVPAAMNPSVLEVGAGNGALLFALVEAGYTSERIYGIDYSEDAVKLAKAIGTSKGDEAEKVTFGVCDFLTEYPAAVGLEGELSRKDAWDLVLDKGTFDAMALAEKDGAGGRHAAEVYPRRVGEVIRPGGHFLIVCELLARPACRIY